MSSRGGARNRSGPAPDPNSGRSDRRGLSFQALPNEGFQGEVPEFPIPIVGDHRALQIWAESWRTPQAAAWALESWRWQILAEYCLIVADIEDDPKAALVAQLHRYRDQLGLTPAGMRENGWAVAQPEVAQSRRSSSSEGGSRPQRRMRAV